MCLRARALVVWETADRVCVLCADQHDDYADDYNDDRGGGGQRRRRRHMMHHTMRFRLCGGSLFRAAPFQQHARTPLSSCASLRRSLRVGRSTACGWSELLHKFAMTRSPHALGKHGRDKTDGDGVQTGARQTRSWNIIMCVECVCV